MQLGVSAITVEKYLQLRR